MTHRVFQGICRPGGLLAANRPLAHGLYRAVHKLNAVNFGGCDSGNSFSNMRVSTFSRRELIAAVIYPV